MNEKQLLFLLLKLAFVKEQVKLEGYSEEILKKLYTISTGHNVVHLVASVLEKSDIKMSDELKKAFRKQKLIAMYRYEQIRYDFDNLCCIFEQLKIPFIPLKGSVIRKFYPEEWMRTSCDIDILVQKQDLERVKQILIDEFKYTYHRVGSHDMSFYTPTNVHVELHYTLIENGMTKAVSKVLENVWDFVRVRDGFDFWFEMPDELYYFYHVAHMAKHFENGGCGVRPFVDLWILDNIREDVQKRNELLSRGKLLKFSNAMRKLNRIWFSNEEYDSVSFQLENYVLCGGAYGNNTNRILVQQQKKGGHIGYTLSKIFVPYDVIKYYYPVLQKHPWLTPVMEVRRWCKLLFGGQVKQKVEELKYGQNISSNKANETKEFLSSIGL